MPGEQILGGGGAVSVGTLSFVVKELSVQGEVRLFRKLAAEAKQAMGPGSFYAEALPTLKWLADQGHHADRAALVEIVGRLIATKAPVSEAAVDEYRQTPDGVATELYWRTRQTHPDATREELRAVVNEANALDVHLGILEATAPKKEGATTP